MGGRRVVGPSSDGGARGQHKPRQRGPEKGAANVGCGHGRRPTLDQRQLLRHSGFERELWVPASDLNSGIHLAAGPDRGRARPRENGGLGNGLVHARLPGNSGSCNRGHAADSKHSFSGRALRREGGAARYGRGGRTGGLLRLSAAICSMAGFCRRVQSQQWQARECGALAATPSPGATAR